MANAKETLNCVEELVKTLDGDDLMMYKSVIAMISLAVKVSEKGTALAIANIGASLELKADEMEGK